MKLLTLTELALALIVGLGTGQTASGQSFDCSRATTAVERTICASHELRDLDTSLALVLKQAISGAPGERRALVAQERRWISYRDGHCGYSFNGTLHSLHGKPPEECLAKIYQARIEELKSRGDNAPLPPIQGVIETADPQLCSQLHADPLGLKLQLPSDAKTPHLYDSAGLRIDVDNSGKPMWVVAVSHGARVESDDVIFGFDDAAWTKLQSTKRSEPDLVENATVIYPRTWATCSPRELWEEKQDPVVWMASFRSSRQGNFAAKSVIGAHAIRMSHPSSSTRACISC